MYFFWWLRLSKQYHQRWTSSVWTKETLKVIVTIKIKYEITLKVELGLWIAVSQRVKPIYFLKVYWGRPGGSVSEVSDTWFQLRSWSHGSRGVVLSSSALDSAPSGVRVKILTLWPPSRLCAQALPLFQIINLNKKKSKAFSIPLI